MSQLSNDGLDDRPDGEDREAAMIWDAD